ncbi:hypothetical protein VTH82DRAFT_6365 [Thermothelomyces myriococcoides]
MDDGLAERGGRRSSRENEITGADREPQGQGIAGRDLGTENGGGRGTVTATATAEGSEVRNDAADGVGNKMTTGENVEGDTAPKRTSALDPGEEPEKPKEKPNFANSGLLAAASNTITQADGTTVTLKYHEPPEARKPPPRDMWKLFIFKGEDIIDTIELSTRSCWLIGRDLAVVDLPAEHPSISKQHAVIQFRYTEKRNEYGDKIGRVKPYLIDLESANGTMLNGEKVPESRYLELRNKDMLQFGSSTREYVLMLAPRD